jgi:ferritin-like metal-binding protein YciE
MSIKTLDELFEHELKDIYYAEHRLVEALTELAGETKDREIKRAYTSHKKETQGQIKRLQKVFRLFGKVPEVEKCPGIEGLLKEKHQFTKKEKPTQEILDFFNLGAAAKTERYEITAYESLIEMAQQLGMAEGVELLAQNLQEEETALETVKALAGACDLAAMMATDEEEGEEKPSGSSKASGASKKSGAAAKKSSKAPVKKPARKGDARATAGESSASRSTVQSGPAADTDNN